MHKSLIGKESLVNVYVWLPIIGVTLTYRKSCYYDTIGVKESIRISRLL